MLHCLSGHISSIVLPLPISDTHTDELEEDVIVELPWSSEAELLADSDHISPQCIVTIHLSQHIAPPLLLIKPLCVQSPMQHSGSNLGQGGLTDKCCQRHMHQPCCWMGMFHNLSQHNFSHAGGCPVWRSSTRFQIQMLHPWEDPCIQGWHCCIQTGFLRVE